VLESPRKETTSTTIRGASSSDIEVTVRINRSHAGGFDLPVQVIVLDYAERVNPNKTDSKSPNDCDGILKGSGQALPVYTAHPLRKSFLGRLDNANISPAMTQCRIERMAGQTIDILGPDQADY
jgi:hypothetical protein